MPTHDVLTLIEDLLRAAQHPEIVTVKPIEGDKHKPAGVAVKFTNGSGASLVVMPARGWQSLCASPA